MDGWDCKFFKKCYHTSTLTYFSYLYFLVVIICIILWVFCLETLFYSMGILFYHSFHVVIPAVNACSCSFGNGLVSISLWKDTLPECGVSCSHLISFSLLATSSQHVLLAQSLICGNVSLTSLVEKLANLLATLFLIFSLFLFFLKLISMNLITICHVFLFVVCWHFQCLILIKFVKCTLARSKAEEQDCTPGTLYKFLYVYILKNNLKTNNHKWLRNKYDMRFIQQ